LHKYLLKLVPGPDFKKDSMKYIESKVVEVLGANTVVEYEIVDNIPRTSAGKFRDFVDERKVR